MAIRNQFPIISVALLRLRSQISGSALLNCLAQEAIHDQTARHRGHIYSQRLRIAVICTDSCQNRFRSRCSADLSPELRDLSWSIAADEWAAARPQKLGSERATRGAGRS